MTREEANIVLETIRNVTYYPHENQYDSGPKSINENGIKILNAVVKGLVEEDDDL